MIFTKMLRDRWQEANTMACVGLDSDYSQISKGGKTEDVFADMKNFNFSVVTFTRDLVCAYKPNIAFYEDQWFPGLRALQETFNIIRALSPDTPIILDAKRTDIGNTNKGYVKMAFDVLGADAITVNPYFGGEALKPFLDRADKGVIVLCRTSNPGAKEFQDLQVPVVSLPIKARDFFVRLEGDTGSAASSGIAIRLYEYVAWRAAYEWNSNNNVILVVGATYPAELAKVRRIVRRYAHLSTGNWCPAG